MTSHQGIPTEPPPPSAARDLDTFFEGHHKGLKAHLLRLAEATDQPVPRDSAAREQWQADILDSLSGLRGFAELHFAEEEKLMEDVSYPGTSNHMREHRAFIQYLDDLQSLVADGAPNVQEMPGGVLAQWWDRHSTEFDSALAAFLCRGGI